MVKRVIPPGVASNTTHIYTSLRDIESSYSIVSNPNSVMHASHPLEPCLRQHAIAVW